MDGRLGKASSGKPKRPRNVSGSTLSLLLSREISGTKDASRKLASIPFQKVRADRLRALEATQNELLRGLTGALKDSDIETEKWWDIALAPRIAATSVTNLARILGLDEHSKIVAENRSGTSIRALREFTVIVNDQKDNKDGRLRRSVYEARKAAICTILQTFLASGRCNSCTPLVREFARVLLDAYSTGKFNPAPQSEHANSVARSGSSWSRVSSLYGPNGPWPGISGEERDRIVEVIKSLAPYAGDEEKEETIVLLVGALKAASPSFWMHRSS